MAEIEAGMYYFGAGGDTIGEILYRNGNNLRVFALSGNCPYGEEGSVYLREVGKIITADQFKSYVYQIMERTPYLNDEEKKKAIAEVSEKTGLEL